MFLIHCSDIFFPLTQMFCSSRANIEKGVCFKKSLPWLRSKHYYRDDMTSIYYLDVSASWQLHKDIGFLKQIFKWSPLKDGRVYWTSRIIEPPKLCELVFLFDFRLSLGDTPKMFFLYYISIDRNLNPNITNKKLQKKTWVKLLSKVKKNERKIS